MILLLKAYIEIVDNNSISKAAEKLHITQQGLSIQLKKLEDLIGSKLLIRNNKGVEVTEEGRIVYQYGKKMMALEEDLYNDIELIKDNKKQLHLNTCTCLGYSKIPKIIYEFSKEYQNIEVFLNPIASGEVLTKVKQKYSENGNYNI